MSKGYLIVQVDVTDPDAYARYGAAAGDLLRVHGARMLVDPASALVVEGRPRARTVIFEFESFEKARAFWDSPDYAAAKALRSGAADGDFILMQGAT